MVEYDTIDCTVNLLSLLFTVEICKEKDLHFAIFLAHTGLLHVFIHADEHSAELGGDKEGAVCIDQLHHLMWLLTH